MTQSGRETRLRADTQPTFGWLSKTTSHLGCKFTVRSITSDPRRTRGWCPPAG